MPSVVATRTRRGGVKNQTPVTPNLAAWYRYRKGITITNGGVSAWADASQNTRNLVQATASARPTMLSDGTIVFDGVAQYLQATFTLAQPFTLYLLFKQLSWTSTDVIIDGVTGLTQLIQDTASPGIAMNGGSGLTVSNTALVGAFAVAAAVFNSTTSVYQVGAGGPTVTTSGDAGANTAGGITLGASRTPLLFSNIAVRELIVYSEAHDATTRLRVLRYLGSLGASVGGV